MLPALWLFEFFTFDQTEEPKIKFTGCFSGQRRPLVAQRVPAVRPVYIGRLPLLLLWSFSPNLLSRNEGGFDIEGVIEQNEVCV